jgi:hypothetical protein
MKKTIFVSFALVMLMISTVFAVTPDVNCGMFGMVCNEKNVQKAVNELSTTDEELSDKIETNDLYVKDNENAWLKDVVGGGISRHSVEDMLFAFIETLKEHFATKDKLEKAEQRIDVLEARLDLFEEAVGSFTTKEAIDKRSKELRAARTGLTTCNEVECYFIVAR